MNHPIIYNIYKYYYSYYLYFIDTIKNGLEDLLIQYQSTSIEQIQLHTSNTNSNEYTAINALKDVLSSHLTILNNFIVIWNKKCNGFNVCLENLWKKNFNDRNLWKYIYLCIL